MRTKRNLVGIIALFITSVCATAASADPITATYDFSAAFSSGPNPLITGKFTLTYTPDVNNSPVMVSNFSSAALANYTPVSGSKFQNGYLAVGNQCVATGGCSVSFGTYQFALSMNVNAAGDPNGSYDLIYSAGGGGMDADTTTVTRESTAPEPAAWAMMTLGMGAAGFALRLRRKATPRVACAG